MLSMKLKKHLDSFEKTYGKDGKRVMYAVATRDAKKEKRYEDYTHYPVQVDPKKDKRKGNWIVGDPMEPIVFDGNDTKSILDKANKTVEKQRGVKVKPYAEEKES